MVICIFPLFILNLKIRSLEMKISFVAFVGHGLLPWLSEKAKRVWELISALTKRESLPQTKATVVQCSGS